ncbi:MAG: hypothetical protein MJZ52_07050 [Bacteroidales bacterium]|nr:hypothetical protein [Bacteroidales bacterium]
MGNEYDGSGWLADMPKLLQIKLKLNNSSAQRKIYIAKGDEIKRLTDTCNMEIYFDKIVDETNVTDKKGYIGIRIVGTVTTWIDIYGFKLEYGTTPTHFPMHDPSNAILDFVDKKTEGLYNENLLVNLGNFTTAIGEPLFDGVEPMPCGVHSQSGFKWNKTNGYIYPTFKQSNPVAYINMEYARDVAENSLVLQMRLNVNGQDFNVGAITHDSEIEILSSPKVTMRVYFNKMFTSTTMVSDSNGKIAVRFVWNGLNPLPTIKIYGFKLECGNAPTKFPVADSSTEILRHARLLLNEIGYRVGNKIILSDATQVYAGIISGSSKSMWFFIPLSLPYSDDVTSVRISGKFMARGINGYLNNNSSSDSTWNFDGSDNIVNEIKFQTSMGGIRVWVDFNTAPVGAVNNTPVSVMNSGTCTIEFI